MPKLAILVTGMSGAGKTVYCADLGFPTLHFDSIHDYPRDRTDYRLVLDWALENLDKGIVLMDGWKFYWDPDLSTFRGLLGFAGRDIEVRMIYTTPVLQYLAQLEKERKGHYAIPSGQRTLRSNAVEWSRNVRTHVEESLTPLVRAGVRVRWMFRRGDGTYEEHGDPSHLLDVTSADPVEELLDWIGGTSGDPTYQTIELDGEVIRDGYTHSEKSWEVLQKLEIDWRGKTVWDLGCFNGYFCDKVERAGAARVVGYDQDIPVMKIAPVLASLRRSGGTFCPMNLTVDFPSGACDVALVMNSLHHIAPDADAPEFRRFVERVFRCSRQSVWEVERDAEDKIKSIATGFNLTLAHNLDSHRVTEKGTRRWLHFRKELP